MTLTSSRRGVVRHAATAGRISEYVTRWSMAAIALVAMAATVTSLGNGFTYDDIPIIATNARVHSLSSWWTLFGTSYWPPSFGESLYRPLSMLSYALQWAVGKGNPMLFHAVSIALFVLLAVLVLALLREVLDERSALVGGVLFAAHPVHTEAVANVVGQAELLAAIGVVAATTLYIRARRRGGPDLRQALGISALYAGASLAKEHALLLPLLIGATELLVCRQSNGRADGRVGRLLLLLAVVAIAVLGARTAVLGSLFGEQNPVEMDLPTRIWTMFRVIPEWVRLLAWPAKLSAEYGPQQIEVVNGPGPLSVLGVAFAVVGVVVLVMSLSRDKALGLGLTWLAITFAPVSNLVSGVVLQERTLMLPSVGAMMVFAAAFHWLWREASTVQARRAIVAMVVMMAVLGAWRSGQRNPVWRDNLTLFTHTVQDAPRSYRAHYVYGSELFNVGRPADGERELRRSIALSRNDSDPYNFLATKYREAKLYAQAIPLYRTALEIRPGRPDSRFGLAFSLLETGDARGALAHADTGLAFGQLKSYFEWVKTRADSALRAQRLP